MPVDFINIDSITPTGTTLGVAGEVNLTGVLPLYYRINGVPLSFDASQINLAPQVGAWTTVQAALGGLNTAVTNIVSSQWVNGAGGAIYYNAGNVGVGTATPSSKLDVIGNIASSNYVMGVGLWAGSSTATGNPEVAIQTDSSTWKIVNNGTGTALPGALEFRSETDVQIPTSRFLMDTLGRVRMGIGPVGPAAAWPEAALNIVGDQNVVNSLLVDIAFSNYRILVPEKRIAILQCLTGASADSGVLTFNTANAGVMGERMRIDSQGRVGIGTLSPQAALDVNGTIRASGPTGGSCAQMSYGAGAAHISGWNYTASLPLPLLLQANSGNQPIGGTVAIGIPDAVNVDLTRRIHILGSDAGVSAGIRMEDVSGEAFTTYVGAGGWGVWDDKRAHPGLCVRAGNVGVKTSVPTTALDIADGVDHRLHLGNMDWAGYGPAMGVTATDDSNNANVVLALWAPHFVFGFGVITMQGLENYDPGAGSKRLWYDPADGNRVKFAA